MNPDETVVARDLQAVAEEAAAEFTTRRTPRWVGIGTGLAHVAIDNDPQSLCRTTEIGYGSLGMEPPPGFKPCPNWPRLLDSLRRTFLMHAVERRKLELLTADVAADPRIAAEVITSRVAVRGKTFTFERPASPPELTPEAARLLLELLDLGGGAS